MALKLSYIIKTMDACEKLQSDDLPDDSYYGAVLKIANTNREIGIRSGAVLGIPVIEAIIRCLSAVVAVENNESLIAEHTERILEVMPEIDIPEVKNAIKTAKASKNKQH